MANATRGPTSKILIESLTHSNTHLRAGERVLIESGDDTILAGAVVSAERVEADIGGDLLIESLQDRATYKERSKQTSASATFGAGAGGSYSSSSSNIESEYASVGEQSAIRAGDAGFDIKVKGKTVLKGGAITSTQVAVDKQRNGFESDGGLELEDVHNEARYKAKARSVTAGVYVSDKKNGDGTTALGPDGQPLKEVSRPGGVGWGDDKGHASSTTRAGISGIAGDKDARTGDAEVGLAPIFDKDKVKDEIDAQVVITKGFGQQASKAVGDFAAQQLQDAREKLELAEQAEAAGDAARAAQLRGEAQQLQDDWGDQGTMRLLAHTVVGGLSGGAAGAAGAATGTLTAPVVADALHKAGIDDALAETLTALASTATGAAVGGSTGAGAAFNEVTNNYLSHQERATLNKADKACKTSGRQCDTAAALKYKDELSDRLLANAVASCEGEACNDTVQFINQQLVALGCTAPQACPDQTTLLGYWNVAQQKAQGLEGVYPETWLLDAKALLDLGKLGIREIAGSGKGSLDALNALSKASADDLAKVGNNIYRDTSLGDPAKALSPLGDWKPASLIDPREAEVMVRQRLPRGEVVDIASANKANADVLAEDIRFKPPYVPNTQIVSIQTAQPETFVRVYVQEANKSELAGSWMMRADDIAGLTPEQIASKYALPQVPTHVADVRVPAGNTLRVSVANDVHIKQGLGGNGGGGGVQFEVTSRPSIDVEFESWFTNPRRLK